VLVGPDGVVVVESEVSVPASVATPPGAVVDVVLNVTGGRVVDGAVVDGMPVAFGVTSLLPQAARARRSRRRPATRFMVRRA
jgi:hypothetical protein